MKNILHIISYIIYGLIIINLLYINYVVITEKNRSPAAETSSIPATEKSETAKSLTATKISSSTCDKTCINAIYEAIENATKAATKDQSINTQKTQANNVTVKEFFIPFGSGFSSAGEWTDISGMSATIDSANYKGIKNVVFEATLRIPTGNQIAYARLFNVTDKHPVWFSEVLIEGGTPSLVTSQHITLDSGNKVYQVQMKTSLKYQSFIDQARMRVTIQ